MGGDDPVLQPFLGLFLKPLVFPEFHVLSGNIGCDDQPVPILPQPPFHPKGKKRLVYNPFGRFMGSLRLFPMGQVCENPSTPLILVVLATTRN